MTLAAQYPTTYTGGTGIVYAGTQADPLNVAMQFIEASISGTVTFNDGDTRVDGVGTEFTLEVVDGDFIRMASGGEWVKVSSVVSDTELTLARPYEGGASGPAVISPDGIIDLQTPPHDYGDVDDLDYTVWKSNFGMTGTFGAGAIQSQGSQAVPEPTALVIAGVGVAMVAAGRRRPTTVR